MGLKVTAAQAGWLVDRHERIVRGHVKRGDLPAQKVGNAWRIDVEDLERVPGWQVDRGRLAQLEEREARTVEGLSARVATLERELRELRGRLRALELRSSVEHDAGVGVEDRNLVPVLAASGMSADYYRPPVIPYSANLVQVPAPAPGDFPSRQAVARFLGRHGIPEPTARSWWNGKPWPATPRDALADVLHRLTGPEVFRLKWRNDLRRCDDPECECREVLAE